MSANISEYIMACASVVTAIFVGVQVTKMSSTLEEQKKSSYRSLVAERCADFQASYTAVKEFLLFENNSIDAEAYCYPERGIDATEAEANRCMGVSTNHVANTEHLQKEFVASAITLGTSFSQVAVEVDVVRDGLLRLYQRQDYIYHATKGVPATSNASSYYNRMKVAADSDPLIRNTIDKMEATSEAYHKIKASCSEVIGEVL